MPLATEATKLDVVTEYQRAQYPDKPWETEGRVALRQRGWGHMEALGHKMAVDV